MILNTLQQMPKFKDVVQLLIDESVKEQKYVLSIFIYIIIHSYSFHSDQLITILHEDPYLLKMIIGN